VIGLRQRLVLNSDIVITPIHLPGGAKDAEAAGDDFAVTRTASRSPTLAVSRETAEFLMSFAAPNSLLSTVQLIAKRTSHAPEEILEEIYPHLRTFVDRGILVRLGNARRATRALQIGPWMLERPINDFEDSSVFLVKNSAGQFGALKLYKQEPIGQTSERERLGLQLAGDDLAPQVLDHGPSPLGPYIVTTWKSGSVAADTFGELRTAPNPRPALLTLTITLVKAFERLHERGILHGDIQPKNVIVDLHGRIWIIDFPHAFVPGLPAPTWRMGVPFFFEPEYAKASLEKPPRLQELSVAGENYAIAAMLFYLLSGVHSIEFSVDRDALLRQIAEAEPRGLRDPRGAEWNGADQAIRPYLAKDPAQRPRTLAPLLEGLLSALSQETATPAYELGAPPVSRITAPERTLKQSFGLGSSRLRDFDLAAPRCSVTFGAAGIAYALLRAAELCEDSELLWASDAWIEQAEQHARAPDAFTSSEIGLTRRRIGYASLSSSEPGLFFVKSLVRAAMNDLRGLQLSVDQFYAAATSRPSHHADVNLGGVGLALAADRLTALPLAASQRRRISALRDELMACAWRAVRPDFSGSPRLGFAHGIAGVVFGALTTQDTTNARVAVEKLRGSAAMIRKGVRWPVRAAGGFFMPGWCNGVAGHLLMWTRTWQISGDPDDREMMERIAWGVMESRTALGNVCCGVAGQAIALASFAASTRDPTWRKRGSEFLDGLKPRWPKDDNPQSLFRGELGLLLARLECASDAPRFPVWGASLVQNSPALGVDAPDLTLGLI
jgi:serine/threonine protein kinase